MKPGDVVWFGPFELQYEKEYGDYGAVLNDYLYLDPGEGREIIPVKKSELIPDVLHLAAVAEVMARWPDLGERLVRVVVADESRWHVGDVEAFNGLRFALTGREDTDGE